MPGIRGQGLAHRTLVPGYTMPPHAGVFGPPPFFLPNLPDRPGGRHPRVAASEAGDACAPTRASPPPAQGVPPRRTICGDCVGL